jgi:hypothetical protein
VKTLKDPPEIWDLVHEVPNQRFNARTAFVSRIKSMNRALAVGAFAGLLFAISCGVAAFVFRTSESGNLATELPPVQTPAEVRVEPPKPVENSVTEPVANAENPLSSHVVRKAPETRPFKVRPVIEENIVPQQAASREEPQVAAPEIEKSKPAQSPMKSAPNAALSPHLITPARSAPAKGKVIQWP